MARITVTFIIHDILIIIHKNDRQLFVAYNLLCIYGQLCSHNKDPTRLHRPLQNLQSNFTPFARQDRTTVNRVFSCPVLRTVIVFEPFTSTVLFPTISNWTGVSSMLPILASGKSYSLLF